MRKIITKLIANGLTPRVGDINTLVRGLYLEFTSHGHPTVKSTKRDKQGPSLKSALRAAIATGLRFKTPQLPDCNMFRVELASFNPLYFAEGIQARLGSDKVIFRYRNGRSNRYLNYMTLRLVNLSSTPPRFWAEAIRFIRFSDSFLVASLHGISKNHYREVPQRKTLLTLMAVNDLRARFLSRRLI